MKAQHAGVTLEDSPFILDVRCDVGPRPCRKRLFRIGLSQRSLWLFWEHWSHQTAKGHALERRNAQKEQQRISAEGLGMPLAEFEDYPTRRLGPDDVADWPWVQATSAPVRLADVNAITVPLPCDNERALITDPAKLATAWKRKVRKPDIGQFAQMIL